MPPIGIIANPASGKDIRRLVAFGSVFDNNEKVNIVRRILLGLDAIDVRQVYIMPDFFGIGARALQDLDLGLNAAILEMETDGTQDDSTRAAREMVRLGAGCIVTLGGDGTNRAVAKGCGDVPLMALSTGTNNVFPVMAEGTLAGMAAGFAAGSDGDGEAFIHATPRLEIKRGGRLVEIALVDAVVSKAGFVASRALWQIEDIHEIFLARSDPAHIGFSAIGGILHRLPAGCGQGLHIRIGAGNGKVSAPIAPGLVKSVPIEGHRVISPDEAVAIRHQPALIALDGERELAVTAREPVTINLSLNGPRVIDLTQALRQAAVQSVFRKP